MRRERASRGGIALALCALLACGAMIAASPAAAVSAVALKSASARRAPARQAPSAPPLLSGASAYATPSQSAASSNGESEPESAAAGEDPLVRNGLGSPLCHMDGAELSSSAADDCRTSGFVASGAPSEDYSFDTNIDTTLGVSIDAMLQDYVVRPVWMFLVWLVHALLVVLEWAYTLELLRGPVAGEIGQSLRAAQAQFTAPWMASALACAAVLAAYQGIVRRRVAQTLGEAAAMLAMIVFALVVIADPSGTVGALSRWAQEASVGTFGAISSGSSARPYRALAQSLQELYAVSIEAPWCFMEFGNVGWCDAPARLDPRLEAAAQHIAAKLKAQARSGASTGGLSAPALEHRAQLLAQAQTNGSIFLALPANGPLRNSVKERTSLLYVLCGGAGDATSCRGPTASEAEFRANSGTLPRLAGLGLIGFGVSGMLLLIGVVTARLLEAAIISVLFLLLAPAAALAPAVGEAGRRAFAGWATRLLGAAAAKLLWSIALGALLACMRVLLSLHGLGWLVQWMLSCALWWGVFLRRHELLGGGAGHQRAQGAARQSRLTRRVEEKLSARTRHAAKVTGKAAGKAVWRRISPGRPRDLFKSREQQEAQEAASAKRGSLARIAGEAAGRLAESASPPPLRDRGARRGSPAVKSCRSRMRSAPERLQELAGAHAEALANGDTRRAVSLRLRMQRVREQMAASGLDGPDSARAHGASRRKAKDDAQPARADRLHRSTPPPRGRPGGESSKQDGAAAPNARRRRADLDAEIAQRRQAAENPVMRDAIEVAQRRKRQLGWSSKEEQR